MTNEFEKAFAEMEAPDYPSTCDECGAEGTNASLENHECRQRPYYDGVAIIAAERRRQIHIKGYTPEHDDEHDLGELGLAAALYALPYEAKVGDEPLLKQDDFIALHIALETGCEFFLDPEPDRITRLAKAGALIAAEIDRLSRAALAARQPGSTND